jgi:hypothetical protein
MALIMTTGYGLTALPSTFDSESIGYLTKPFTHEQLMKALEWAAHWQVEQASARMRRTAAAMPARSIS